MEQVVKVVEFIIDSFVGIWPYLLITIPIAVVVNLSGISKRIHKVVSARPLVSVLLATIVGAFSPFCSCGVIPVIASFLIGGVPLAPVMSFWIASPSMDPEIFFLSTATIGLKLSLWRLIATFCISILAGYITHIAMVRGWLGTTILRDQMVTRPKNPLKSIAKRAMGMMDVFLSRENDSDQLKAQMMMQGRHSSLVTVNCCISVDQLSYQPIKEEQKEEAKPCDTPSCSSKQSSFWPRLLKETTSATLMVAKFMTLAFFINALIHFYVPQSSISGLLGGSGLSAISIASLVGIPFYTSNLTALPLVSGLLEMGMNEGAALAFLISGPITTLPAMAAVWGIVKRKVFVLYLSFALVGSVLFGLLFNLWG